MRITLDFHHHAPLFAAFHTAGFDLYYVGGAVRNAVMGLPADDIDLATNATPDQMQTLLTQVGIRTIPTGVDHGTLTAVLDHQPYEITTYRRDVSSDGRNATVSFATSIEEDAQRRDFTMNALYGDHTGQVIDPLGHGLDDTLARHVRFIGNADQRIKEDYLRILRFFRFYAWYGDGQGIDADGLAACAMGAEGLARVSVERITHEVLKLLRAPDPAPAMAAMAQSGILASILPGADMRALAPLVHLQDAPDALPRLFVLGGWDALRLSKKQTACLQDYKTHLQTAPFVLGHLLGRQRGQDVLRIKAAMFGTPLNPTEWDEVTTGAAAIFPINAQDLPHTGAALGQALRGLKTTWLDHKGGLGKQELLAGLADNGHD